MVAEDENEKQKDNGVLEEETEGVNRRSITGKKG